MIDLITRLEAATEPTPALFYDAYVAVFDRLTADDGERGARFEQLVRAEAWTDAALMLVPEGLGWRVGANPGASKYAGEAEIEDPKDGGWQFTVEANGRSPALALCIAALRARTPPTEETG